MLTFDTIIEKDGKTYLFAQADFEKKAAKLAELQDLCNQIPAVLAGADLDVSPDAVKAVYNSGGVGLQNVLENAVIATMERLQLPAFMRATYLQGAKTALDTIVFQKVGAIHTAICTAADGIPVDLDTDMRLEDGAVILDCDTIREKMRPAFSLSVSDDDKANAEKVLALAAQVRELELSGLNALELLGVFYKMEDTPAPLSLSAILPVVLKRHKAGQVQEMVCMTSWEHMQMYSAAK